MTAAYSEPTSEELVPRALEEWRRGDALARLHLALDTLYEESCDEHLDMWVIRARHCLLEVLAEVLRAEIAKT